MIKTKFKEGTEEYRMLWDYYNTIPFLSWMAQPKSKRGTAKDRPKDSKGRIIVDVTRPHVLEDMDYFRPAAIVFEKTGKYTSYFPSKNPSSPYRKFWDEEIRRCREGYVRERDGEWIPGYYYFYLNYSVILKTVVIGERAEDGSVRAERVPGFPEVWDGDYLFFHYIEQAEQSGKHTATLKRRGSGYSFKNASMLQRNFYHYRKSKSYAVAADSAYLDSDGILNKAEDIFSFVNKHAGFAKKLALKDTLYHRISGYKYPGDPTEYGFKSERLGLTLNNNVDRIRGKRGKLIIWEEAGSFPNLIKAWRIAINSMEEGRRVFGLMSSFGCVCKGTMVYDRKGRIIPIEKLKLEDGIAGFNGKEVVGQTIIQQNPKAKKECNRLSFIGNDDLECSNDHPILKVTSKYSASGTDRFVEYVRADSLKPGDKVAVVDSVPLFGTKKVKDARLLGILIGDGYYGRNVEVGLSSKMLSDYVKNNYSVYTDKEMENPFYNRLNIRGFVEKLKEYGMYGQTKFDKRLPENIYEWDKDSIAKLLAGYFDTDGNSKIKQGKYVSVVLTSVVKELLVQVKYNLLKFGIHSTITKENRNVEPVEEYKGQQNYIFRLYINKNNDVRRFMKYIPVIAENKWNHLKKIRDDVTSIKYIDNAIYNTNDVVETDHFITSSLSNMRFVTVKSNVSIGVQTIYNLTAGKHHNYIANGIITHNTGGDKSQSFQGLEVMFYNPKAFRILDLPNVYDKNVEKSRCAFFVPAYMNRADCYDKNGNSDVIKALEEIVEDRVEVIRTSSSSEDIAQVKAEQPVVPRDAVMRTQGTSFPVKELSEHLAEIEPTIDEYLKRNYIVDLIWDHGNKIVWKPNFESKAIRTYPFRETDTRGAVEIAELPKTGSNGEVPWGRYIVGVDPVDDDMLARGILSLFAAVVFDLWTDTIVGWWIGRHQKVNDNFDMALKLAVFYNAQINYENKLKGMYAYCDRKNMLRYLMTTPEILKDMEYVKAENLTGNKAYGTPPTKQINNWARQEQADWMLSANETYENRLNYKLIKSLRYLQEAYSWNIDANFDFVSAMNMVMIARADRYKFIESSKDAEYESNEWDNDPFFVQNYKGNTYITLEDEFDF